MAQKISRNDYFKLIRETGRIPKDDEYEIIPLDLSAYPLNEDTVRIADKNFTEEFCVKILAEDFSVNRL